MDPNKTIYPGMPMSGYSGRSFPENGRNHQGTYYPAAEQPNERLSSGEKPLVGFLYSVSKTMLGEYWPLRAGSNPIGRSSDSAVCLKESTVSDKHANLVIRQMHNEDGSVSILAFVQDLGSTCGTMVNGVSLGFDPKECKNGDVITIGENYELYFILIDRLGLNLLTKDSFIPVQESAPLNGAGPIQPLQPYSTRIDNVGGSTCVNSSPFANQKSTIYMPNKK